MKNANVIVDVDQTLVFNVNTEASWPALADKNLRKHIN